MKNGLNLLSKRPVLRTCLTGPHLSFSLTGICFILQVLLAGCGKLPPPPVTPPALSLNPLDSPAPVPSAEPNLAQSPTGDVYLSWVVQKADGATLLQYARLENGQWAEPQTIARGRDWFVNWADFPALAIYDSERMAAHYLAKSGESTYAYDVRITTTIDGGQSWNDSFVPHRDGTQTEHGFVSFLPWRDRTFFATWLDGRRTLPGGHGAEGEHGSGAMTLRAAFFDSDGALYEEAELDDRTCDCCQTAAIATPDGEIVVAYRDRSESDIRDISVVRYRNGSWSEPARIHADNWQIPGCPVNGPALDQEEGQIAIVWFTAPADERRVLAAFSTDNSTTFSDPVRIDDGNPLGRVDVVSLTGGTALVSWLEQTDDGGEVRLRRIGRDRTGNLKTSNALTVTRTDPARRSGFPRMIAANRTIIFAWTRVSGESETAVQTAYYEEEALKETLILR